MSPSKAGRPSGTTGQARVLDERELKQVLAVTAAGNHAARNVAIVVLSNYLGLRAKELAVLKIGDVYADGAIKKLLRLVAGYTKGGKHRDLSLENKTVIKALQHYIDDRKKQDGAVFNVAAALFRSQKGAAFSPNAMTRLLSNIYSSAGFNDASSHTGRRSLITKLAYSGIDLNSIRQIAGHSSINTTQRYINDNPMVIAQILKAV
jgi:integrase/recombinase XerD